MTNGAKEPFVSVIMPVYNGGLFLRQAIDSILNQTYQNFELLIADDGSKDNTWEIINSYTSDKLKLFRFDKNRGAFDRANFLFKKSKGQYIAVMDSDDVAHPHRFRKQIDFLLKNPDAIVVGSQINIINENGENIGSKPLPRTHEEIYRQFSRVHPVVHPSCMINRSLLPKRKSLYKTKFGVNSDYHTFIELLSFGKFANLPDTLLDYRIHSSNSSFKDLKKCFVNTVKIRWEAINHFGFRLDPVSIFLLLPQTVIVFLLPGKLLTGVYLILRGIKPPKEIFSDLVVSLKSTIATKPMIYETAH